MNTKTRVDLISALRNGTALKFSKDGEYEFRVQRGAQCVALAEALDQIIAPDESIRYAVTLPDADPLTALIVFNDSVVVASVKEKSGVEAEVDVRFHSLEQFEPVIRVTLRSASMRDKFFPESVSLEGCPVPIQSGSDLPPEAVFQLFGALLEAQKAR